MAATRPDRVVPPTIQADTVNWLIDRVAYLLSMDVEGADLDLGAGGPLLRVPKIDRGFWASVTASTDIDAPPDSYGWTQQRPTGDGGWEDDPNGRSGTAVDDPAFEANGGGVRDGDVVWLRRGLAVVVSGGGSDGQVKQEWYFETADGGGANVRVTGAATTTGGHDYYPAVIDLFAAGTFSDGATVWLVQRAGGVLSTDGTGVYWARRYDRKTISGDARPVYVTTQRRWVVDVTCSPLAVTKSA
jgi:hypothetical protein